LFKKIFKMKYKNLTEFDTNLTADVVEWRPLSSTNSDILLCGTYFLNKESNQRSGCIHVLNYLTESTVLETKSLFQYKTSGILDLKWIDENSTITIDSDNILNMHSFNEEAYSLKLKHKLNLNSNGQTCVGLTLDFSHKNDSSVKILSSDTLGNLNLVSGNHERLSLERTIKAHDYEVWSVLIDKTLEENVLYSGADDCALKMWDLRESENKPVNKCEIFEGGVCSIILPQHSDSTLIEGYTANEILCSSYDERIYVLDKRNMKKSLKQSSKLGGGVWKMKLHPTKNLLLCACMHIGVHLVDTTDLNSKLLYEDHGLNNLAYGCDWKKAKHENENKGHDIIATCSFYNHNLRLWDLIY
jgi:diphthine methyl ester acylhydrolase